LARGRKGGGKFFYRTLGWALELPPGKGVVQELRHGKKRFPAQRGGILLSCRRRSAHRPHGGVQKIFTIKDSTQVEGIDVD